MKNNIQNGLFAVALFVLTCSFVEHPVIQPATTNPEIVVAEHPFGGAYLTFAGKFGGEISKADLKGEQNLKVEGCAQGSRIFQFTLTVTKNGKSNSYQSKTGTLSSTMLSSLQGLSAGDEFEFKETKAYLPNSKDVVDVQTRKFVVV